jgi:hypothetical protein
VYDSTFTPKGPTILVTTAVQQALPTVDNDRATSYRVRCLATGYLAWASAEVSAPPTITAAAPTGAVPAVNTIGMTTGGVETFTLPQNAYFKSSVANGFEVTPGEGC